MTIGANGPGAVALGAGDRAAAVAAIKALLRIETNGEDALIGGLADSAMGIAERFLGQVLVARTMAATLTPGGAWRRLSAVPVRTIGAVTGITEGGATVTLPVESYAIDIDADGEGWLRVAGGGFASVTAQLTAGLAEDWAGLPAPIRQGVVMLAAHLFSAREESEAPPAAVAALWRPFRTLRLARAVHS